MQINRNKIFIILLFIFTTFTLNGHSFLHHHESGEDNQCYSCLISSTLSSDDITSEKGLSPELYEELFCLNNYKDIQENEYFICVSDRAPPSN